MTVTLKAARVNIGLTQEELAKEVGVSPVTIWKWETGKAEPRLSQAKRLCDICKVSIDDIFMPEA
jgi:DNA-binding XRE family transcriptional regulator